MSPKGENSEAGTHAAKQLEGQKTQTPEADKQAVDAEKQIAEKDVVAQTKQEVSEVATSVMDHIQHMLTTRYGEENPLVQQALEKIADLAKVGLGLKVKGMVNTVVGFFGFIKKFKPDIVVPDQITSLQNDLLPHMEKLDEISQKIEDVSSGKIFEQALLEAQGITPDMLAGGGKDATFDALLTTLEKQAQELKAQQNMTPAAYELGFQQLLVAFAQAVEKLPPPQTNQAGVDVVTGTGALNTESSTSLDAHEGQEGGEDENDPDAFYDDTEDFDYTLDENEFTYTIPLTFPIAGMKSKDIRSPFGPRKAPKAGASTDHKGVDLAFPVGTDIQSPAAGKVITVAEQKKGAGLYVEIDHGNFITRYFHLNTQDVKKGDIVKPGQKIATVGNTGNSTGPHLHYEIRDKGNGGNSPRKNTSQYKAINPEEFWDFDGDGKVVAMQTHKEDFDAVKEVA